MATRKIRLYGDRLLQKISKPVDKIDSKIITLLDDMWDTLEQYNGTGLAAPQVGVLKRVVVINIPVESDDDNDDDEASMDYYEFINPVILETEGEEELTEACLSLPGKNAPVKRPIRVKVKAMDRGGEEFELEGTGLLARALCHEIDHLNGRMYVDIIEPGTLRNNEDSNGK